MFDRFASWASARVASAWFFALCVLLVVVWLPSFYAFGSVDTWQLVINTVTTVLTFLLVALLQNAQERDVRAMQAKLDAQSRALAYVVSRWTDRRGTLPEEKRRLVDDLLGTAGSESL